MGGWTSRPQEWFGTEMSELSAEAAEAAEEAEEATRPLAETVEEASEGDENMPQAGAMHLSTMVKECGRLVLPSRR